MSQVLNQKLNFQQMVMSALPFFTPQFPSARHYKPRDDRQSRRKTAKGAVHTVNPAGAKLVKKAEAHRLTMRHSNGLVGEVFRKEAAKRNKARLEKRRELWPSHL